MKKLSNINESVWSDMEDRGTGNIVKKEDDIDTFDGKKMMEYLIKNYRVNDESAGFVYSERDDVLRAPFLKWHKTSVLTMVHFICYEYAYNTVSIYSNTYQPVIEKLKKKYIVEDFKEKEDWLSIRSKDNTAPTNSFFLEVYNFVLTEPDYNNNAYAIAYKNDVNESIWSDMEDRGTGDQIKAEDELDNLDLERLCEYLKQRYKPTYVNEDISLYKTYIEIPMFRTDTNVSLQIRKPDDREYVMLWMKDIYSYNDFLKNLKEAYKIKTDYVEKDWYDVMISPYDGRPATNTFCVEVIDFILDMHKTKSVNMLKRVVNESVWSDMEDRGTGKIEKIEDQLDNLSPKRFCDYINTHYETKEGSDKAKLVSLQTTIRVDVLTYEYTRKPSHMGVGRMFVTDTLFYDYSEDVIYTGKDESHIMNDLLSKKDYNLSTYEDYYLAIRPNDGRDICNSFFIEVLDYILENSDPDYQCLTKKVNESVWSDMEERGTGEKIKKEDEMEPEDVEKYLERIKTIYTKRFVMEHVYDDKFQLTPDGYKRYLGSNSFSDFWDEKYHKRGRDIIYPIVVKNWDEIKETIDSYIKEEEKAIRDLGYVHNSSESIAQVTSDWWYSLGDGDRAAIGSKNGFEEFVSNYYAEGGSKNTELTEDDWFEDLSYYEQLEVYMENEGVNESVWTDMEERGTGDLTKSEDDAQILEVNDMNASQFVDFISKRYEMTSAGRNTFISEQDGSNCVGVPLVVLDERPYAIFIDGFYKHNKKGVYFNSSFNEKMPDVIEMVKQQFKLKFKPKWIEVYPNDGSEVDNYFMVKVIDYIFQNLDKNKYEAAMRRRVNESVWSDMEDRGSAETIKIEDDINLLDRSGLYDYFKDHYIYNNGLEKLCLIHMNWFYIPAFPRSKTSNVTWIKFYVIYNKSDYNVINSTYIEYGSKINKNFTNHLKENYKIDDNDGFGFMHIYPKEGELNNQFVIDVYDDILKFMNSSIKKRENI